MNTKIKTEEELNAAMRGLVRNIMEHVDHVYNFPLTAEAQAQFVRSMFHQAKEIRDTEPFLRLEVVARLEEYNRLAAQKTPPVDDITPPERKKVKSRKAQAAASQGQKKN